MPQQTRAQYLLPMRAVPAQTRECRALGAVSTCAHEQTSSQPGEHALHHEHPVQRPGETTLGQVGRPGRRVRHPGSSS
eukprot:3956708-Prorocentrum_lima.AAC.1